MSISPRPNRLASFASPFVVGLMIATTGCIDAPPPTGAKAGQDTAAGAAKPAAKPDTRTPKADSPVAAADGCCRYCIDGTPCGDECLPAGKTCDKPEPGCACAGDKRPAKQFRPKQMIKSLIAADVWAYNKAQGDPIAGPFTLEMAFEGAPELADKTKGQLTAVFDTSMGAIECKLFEDKAPLTVANFVGLARGVRPFLDPKQPDATEWKKAPYYDGTIFHRVIEGFMDQAGDPTGSGTGTPGYFIPDEFHPDLRHSGPGVLSMANRNQVDPMTEKLRVDKQTGQLIGNTGSAQFFITVVETSALDDRHTVFGKCETKVATEISKVRVQTRPGVDHRPFDDVTIKKIDFVRK